ncbi:hypothetical protein [Ruegeria atlantica]|uniref:hypothetical protein n=1 Tax=Ruegeria atlantica TaxID=81569 RepID=UPI00147A3F88|nr:hypothetical protein [Ruegeria atlantica]
MTVFFGQKGRPINELESNLRKHLGIPASIEVVEEEYAGEELGLTFDLAGSSNQLNIVATANKLISIALWVSVFEGDDDANEDAEEAYNSYGTLLSENEARELLSDIEVNLPVFRSRAISEGPQ